MKGFFNSQKGTGILFDNVYLAAGIRTGFGKYCGSLSRISPTDLGIVASRGVMKKAGISPADIHQVIAANIGQSSGDAYFLPRHISLFAGIPEVIPSLMVQRICGSGFETIITAGEQITLGKGNMVMCVGTENMSLSPTAAFGNRMGYNLGRPAFIDMLWEALDDTAAGYPMGFTAENVATRYKITREECDTYAMLSFERALAAVARKFFDDEITPVETAVFEIEGLKSRKIKVQAPFAKDEHLRPTTMDALAKLPPVFTKVGVLSAGNCSGIVDGAAAMIVADKQTIQSKNIKPMARIVGAASCGIDPKVMGLGPVPAIRFLLEQTGLTIDQIGLVEINEAFSAQVIGCERELGLDRNKLNVNGGAIALGHPLAATGGRLSLTISREMAARKVKYGIASACIGGGQGTAILLENPEASAK